MAPTNITAVVQSLADLLGVHGVARDVIEAIRPEMTNLIENFATRLDTYEKEHQEEKVRGDKLEHRVATLERQMKRQIVSERKRDVAQVRNAIIIRSNKSEKDIRLFISNCIELGGWTSKVAANHHRHRRTRSPAWQGASLQGFQTDPARQAEGLPLQRPPEV